MLRPSPWASVVLRWWRRSARWRGAAAIKLQFRFFEMFTSSSWRAGLAALSYLYPPGECQQQERATPRTHAAWMKEWSGGAQRTRDERRPDSGDWPLSLRSVPLRIGQEPPKQIRLTETASVGSPVPDAIPGLHIGRLARARSGWPKLDQPPLDCPNWCPKFWPPRRHSQKSGAPENARSTRKNSSVRKKRAAIKNVRGGKIVRGRNKSVRG